MAEAAMPASVSVAAPEPAPATEAAPVEDNRPKKKGWWSLGR
jgi:hypothetical protein